jgi:hypothetical protein
MDMNFSYAYTPQIWPLLLTIIMLIALSFYSWYHRSVPGALPFSFAPLSGALFSKARTLVSVTALQVWRLCSIS